MKKRNFFIIIALLIVIIAGLVVFLITNKKNNQNEEISAELKAAREVFDIRLSSDEKEYIIYDLKKSSNTPDKKVIIPDSIDGIPVTKMIDKDLRNFSGYNKVKTILIGKNINYIGTSVVSNSEDLKYGENIFSACTSLVSIEVNEENSVFSSENGVLYNKDQTVLIKYPSSKTALDTSANHTFTVKDSVVRIYPKAFFQNKTIETVILGSNVKIIDKEAFLICESLVQVLGGESLEIIASRAFEGCINIGDLDVKGPIKKIGYLAFYDCSKLSEIYIPSSIETLEANLFIGCNNLGSIYTEANNVERLKNLLTDSKNTEVVDFVKGKN